METGFTSQIRTLKRSKIRTKVDARLKSFAAFENKSEQFWFSELCFCILTANSKAKTAIEIQKELGPQGFRTASLNKLKQTILKNKHRFYNNKAKYIVEARQHKNVKRVIQALVKDAGEPEARDWLVNNVKGIGYKEASHFLRNVGYKNVAILDRHILNLLVENRRIKTKPKTLNSKVYTKIERILQNIADELKMSQAELDMYLWYMKTGEVLK